MKFNIFVILGTLFFLLSCDQTTINQSKKLDITFDKKYKNSGFSLIYNDDLKTVSYTHLTLPTIPGV